MNQLRERGWKQGWGAGESKPVEGGRRVKEGGERVVRVV